MVWVATLISVVIVSSISLLAILALRLREDTLHRLIPTLVSLAVGALFGDAMIHLLPEAFQKTHSSLRTSLLVLAGLFSSFLFEFALSQGSGEHESGHAHPHSHPHPPIEHIRPAAFINLFASSTHNFVDGILIGTSYLAGISFGIATTLAVILHEIPHELGDFGVLVQSGMTVSRAILFNFLSALVAVFGAIVALLLGQHLSGISEVMLPFTAGSFLYLAGTDLLPGLLVPAKNRKEGSARLIALFSGLGVMLLIRVLE